MKMKNKYLPIKIYICKNTRFFAEIDWILYKCFKKKRINPCGRSKKDKHLCCCQPMKKERLYLSEDKTKCFCKVCNKYRIFSSQPINLDNLWYF